MSMSSISQDTKPQLFAFLLFFALFFSTQMDFRGAELIGQGRSVDIQVIIRLFILGGMLAIHLVYFKMVLTAFRQVPLALHAVYLFYLALVSLNPDVINFYSFYGLATHAAMLFVVVALVLRYGVQNMIFYYYISALIFGLVSLLFYYQFPDIGRYSYEVNNFVFQSDRLKGLGGHPNTFAFAMVIGLLSGFHCYLQKYPVNKALYLGGIILVFCLVLSDSRTNIVAAVLGCGLYVTLHYRGFLLAAGVGACCLGVLVFSLFFSWEIIESLFSILSRSGDASEIKTLTGRSHIWQQLLILIEEKPIFGWGHANLGNILMERRDDVGFYTRQAHNMALQVLFTGGGIGLFLFLASFIAMLVIATLKAMRRFGAFELSVLLCIILGGITESFIIVSIANNNYFVFIMITASLAVFCKQERAK